ncbi:hypothetical protein VU08_06645 [Desulfobulbus sp. F5]|nr:hypothetical protein [Desulfobulbus sp. F5]
MKKGYLSQYFNGVAAKRLSAVEANILRSNQHEFNGTKGIKNILGESEGKVYYKTKFIYLSDYDDEPIAEEGSLTWYDTRYKNINRSAEYRLYFPDNRVSQCANEKDILVIAKRPDDTLLAIVAEAETTIAQQILWLFGFSDLTHPGFSGREELETEQDRVQFASRLILESIGIPVEETEESFLEKMLGKFNDKFPNTKIFSEYARSTLPDVKIHNENDADAVLMAWMEREEILFKTMEKHIIGERLSLGFAGDVDGFIKFSLSVQNRRKIRVGLALENHLEKIFHEYGIRYSRNPITENKSKPDFTFPGKKEYHDASFSKLNLTMLGVKSSCKDRWRQVLSEATRVDKKHLLTLEAAISKNQTDEMASKNLHLILPSKLHQSYLPEQRNWLMSVSNFVQHLLEQQRSLC